MGFNNFNEDTMEIFMVILCFSIHFVILWYDNYYNLVYINRFGNSKTGKILLISD